MATLQGARILVIDDDTLVLAAVSRQLRKLGCVPELASTGREGIALAGAHPFDAAIVDLNMPDMCGTETVDQIRKLSTVPVIVISGALNLRSAQLDSVARLPKPFALHELQAALEAALVVRR